MKQIKLTRDQFALVDDDMFDFLNKWKWCAVYSYNNSFYAVRKMPGKREVLRMHRVILNITDRETQVDHINHNTLDNRRSNLRIVTHAQNAANSSSRKNSTSQFLGVSWLSARNRWRAQIKANSVRITIGYFKDEEAAARAYDAKAIELHREFANLNFK